MFYQQPRLVTHIDDKAINALTEYYAKEIAPARYASLLSLHYVSLVSILGLFCLYSRFLLSLN